MRRRDLLKTMVAPLFAPLLALVPEQAKAKRYLPSRLHEQDVRGVIAGPTTVDAEEMRRALTQLSLDHLEAPWSLPGSDPIADVRAAITYARDNVVEVPVIRDPDRWLTLEDFKE